MACVLDDEELIGNWTLVGDELEQLSGRRGATKLGFALLLRFYAVHGRFPAGRGEIPDQAVARVARLVDVPPDELGLYEWDGRTIKAHRADVRRYFGFRECSVADADKAAEWLASIRSCRRCTERPGVALIHALLCRRGVQPVPLVVKPLQRLRYAPGIPVPPPCLVGRRHDDAEVLQASCHDFLHSHRSSSDSRRQAWSPVPAARPSAAPPSPTKRCSPQRCTCAGGAEPARYRRPPRDRHGKEERPASLVGHRDAHAARA